MIHKQYVYVYSVVFFRGWITRGPSLFFILLPLFAFLWWNGIALITKGKEEEEEEGGGGEEKEEESTETTPAAAAVAEQGRKEEGRKEKKKNWQLQPPDPCRAILQRRPWLSRKGVTLRHYLSEITVGQGMVLKFCSLNVHLPRADLFVRMSLKFSSNMKQL